MKKNSVGYTLLDTIACSVKKRKARLKSSQLNAFVREITVHPFLQPIFGRNNQLAGCEVLLRFRKGKDYLSPSCIHELEDSEHMNRITYTLFKDVERVFSERKDMLPDGFYFSFNIHAAQLFSDALVQQILFFCDLFKGKAGLLLEIVERGTLKLDEATMDIMETLIQKGVRFAIDDFGAGTSSLKYFEHVGFSTIKIDRELTLSLGNELIYQKVIDAIVILSSKLGLSVIAEGVENAEQKELLHKSGIDAMQGYFLARPMPMTDFINQYLN
jgi:EAL domain-containing protein (putative c-di-GMP-specific phosphodiesterase class I)